MGHSENVKKCDVTNRCLKAEEKLQVLGYVPVQIANLTLDDVELKKHGEIGVASPILTESKRNCEICNVIPIMETSEETVDDFDNYLRGKLAHLTDKERCTLEPVLRRYKHLFYGLGSQVVGCASQVEHAIDTGDARPIKRNPYRTPML